jgi:PAS domain S-box-containing protein
MQAILDGKRESYSLEKRYIRKDGDIVWVNLTVSLIRYPNGEPKYFISVVEDIQPRKAADLLLQRVHEELETRIEQRTQDLKRSNEILAFEITQRQQAEAVLKASEERFRAIIKGSHDAFVGINSTGLITDWNDAAEKTFGWTPQEVIGQNIADILIPLQYREAHRRGLERFLHMGEGPVINRRLEMPALARTGDEFPVEMTISAFRNEGSYYFGAFLHDISERKRIAQELEQKQKLLDAVLETIDVGVVACSSSGELTLLNRAAREFHGLSAQDTTPDQWAEQYDLFAADGKTYLRTEDVPLYRALRGETVINAEITIVPKESKARYLLASGKPLIGSAGGKPWCSSCHERHH